MTIINGFPIGIRCFDVLIALPSELMIYCLNIQVCIWLTDIKRKNYFLRNLKNCLFFNLEKKKDFSKLTLYSLGKF